VTGRSRGDRIAGLPPLTEVNASAVRRLFQEHASIGPHLPMISHPLATCSPYLNKGFEVFPKL
jgi:hypothetical protein